MRRYFLISFAGHLVVILGGGLLSQALVPSPPAMDSISVGLAVAPAQAMDTVESTPAPEPDPTPAPPVEPERPVSDPVPDPAPDEPEPEPFEPTPPESDLPPPPPPAEIERPERVLSPDAPPEEPELEPREIVPPDPDLPPPPLSGQDLPEPEPVQPRAQTRGDDLTAEDTTETPPTAPKEELGGGAAVQASTAASELEDGYLVRVQRKIGRRWQPTPASALGQSYVSTVVSFRIRPDGRVEGPTVSESSGLTVFDRQALRAVIDASPLPPLPPRYPDGVHINFRFEYER